MRNQQPPFEFATIYSAVWVFLQQFVDVCRFSEIRCKFYHLIGIFSFDLGVVLDNQLDLVKALRLHSYVSDNLAKFVLK
jgi:hypothetical protein